MGATGAVPVSYEPHAPAIRPDVQYDEYCCVTAKSDIFAVRWQRDIVKSINDVDSSMVCAIQVQFLETKSNTLVLASRSN